MFEVKGNLRVAGQLASLLSVDKRWFWLFGVIAVAGLLGVVCHERRHEIRRFLNGGRARAMKLSTFLAAALVMLAVVTVVTFLLGDRIYESLLMVGGQGDALPRLAMAADIVILKDEVNSLQADRAKLSRQGLRVETEWRKLLADSLPPGSPLISQWKAFRGDVLEIGTALALLEVLPSAINADIAELKRLDAELDSHAEDHAHYLRMKGWIRGGLGLALVGLAAVGGVLFRRGVRHRRRAVANTCPLCLGVNKLHAVPRDNDAVERHGGNAPVQCKNVIGRQPHEECDYMFMSAYRTMEKLCFPTLGIPQAGKTHWLAMLYWELNRGNYPKPLQFEKIKSQSSEDFDIMVEEILNARIGTAATQRERIPHPLVFNFPRPRPLGPVERAGQHLRLLGRGDLRHGGGRLPPPPGAGRRRLLLLPRSDLSQRAAGQGPGEFSRGPAALKGIKAGRRTRTPVALCVSKIDMLAYAGLRPARRRRRGRAVLPRAERDRSDGRGDVGAR